MIWVAVVVAVVVILAVGYVALRQRRHRLRERFGPEYERALSERDNNRGEAEQELRIREQRFDLLDIQPLDPESRQSYARRWTEVQEYFVDAPSPAVSQADQLVTAVMTERGYPTDAFEQQVSDLSVMHGRTLDHYRVAHEISGRAADDEASTEELRQAMVHYRVLFEELLIQSDEQPPRRTAPARDQEPASKNDSRKR